MYISRTDMADERRSDIDPAALNSIPGLKIETSKDGEVSVTDITVEGAEASKAIGKPEGRYITLDLNKKWQNDNDLVIDMAHKLAHQLRPMLPEEGGALVVGLGNRFVTPDALGPLAAEKIVVTRHLLEKMPEIFSGLREVSCITPGVMGQTGMEVLELVKGAVESVRPSVIIAIDALCARGLARLGSSFQISTSGISPGEGAGSRRLSLDSQTLGLPVISIGVPTVTDASSLAHDMLGIEQPPELLDEGGFLVSPGDIDLLAARSAKAIGYGVDLALLGDMPISDMEQMLA